MTIDVPRRAFLLRELSAQLQLNVYIFSSRRKPKRFIAQGAQTTIVLFHSINSYLGHAEYLVLGVSDHPIKLQTSRPPPNLASHGPTEFDPAKFRLSDRVRASHQRIVLDAEICKQFLKTTLIKSIEDQAQKALEKIQREEKSQNGGPTPKRLEQGSRDLRTKLRKYSRLPRGAVTDAMEEVKRIYAPLEITTAIFQQRLKRPDGNIQYWREALEENVDRIWKKAVDDSGQETLASGSRVDDKNSNNRPDAAGSAPEKDGDEGKNEDTRTCLSTLAGVLRPELHQHYGRIMELAEEAQTSVTVMAEELSTLALKTVLLIGSGEGHGQSEGAAQSFRIAEVLTPAFAFRDDNVRQTVQVAPLSPQLESTIEQDPRHDVAKLLGHEHLQFIYARLLRKPAGCREVANNNHPVWEKLVDKMRCDGLPMAPDGLSTTMLGQIKQFATAMENHWTGSTYSKMLEVVVRILLRLHLAPLREEAYKDKVKKIAKRKQEQAARAGTNWPSKDHIKWKTARLFDDLAHVMEGGKSRLTQSLLGQVFKLHSKQFVSSAQLDTTGSQGHLPDDAEGRVAILDDDVYQEAHVLAENGGKEESQVGLMSETFENELERLLSDELNLDPDEIDAAMDEVDTDLDEAATGAGVTGDTDKEPSRAHLRSLEVV
ncbi:hypothetical protein BGZ98_007894 [Dissophora globulifera]|nr:hypothetical protein BGZ98_007894 [Dissophora globulifera]